jgi:hypothetical protein
MMGLLPEKLTKDRQGYVELVTDEFEVFLEASHSSVANVGAIDKGLVRVEQLANRGSHATVFRVAVLTNK